MEYRRLGNTGIKISALSLGSWLTYGNTTGKDTAVDIIHKAYELGINYFDTANVYAGGEAEKIVGEALASYPRTSYVLATKAFFPMGSGVNDQGLSRKHIFEQVHASLKRLDTDYVDIFYCHRFDEETPLYETLRTIEDLIRQGKILYAGVSQWTAAQITEAVGMADRYLLDHIVVNQPPYNMLNRNIEQDVIPVCQRHGLSQVVFSPLAQGMLSGKYEQGQPVPPGSRADHPDTAGYIKRYFTDGNFGKVERLKGIAAELEISMTQLALAWILEQPNITSAILGASRVEQLLENSKAVDVFLSDEVLDAIEAVLS